MGFTGLLLELEALLGHKGYGQVGPWRVVPVRMDLYRDDGECHQVRRCLALKKTPEKGEVKWSEELISGLAFLVMWFCGSIPLMIMHV